MALPEQKIPLDAPLEAGAVRRADPAFLDPAVVREDRAILEFGQRWYPFGGGSSDTIFLEFGLSSSEFFERLSVLLDSLGADLDPLISDAMHTVCRKRLWLGE